MLARAALDCSGTQRRRRAVLRERLRQDEVGQQIPSQPLVRQSRHRGLALGVDRIEGAARQRHCPVVLTRQVRRLSRTTKQPDERQLLRSLLWRHAGPQLDGVLEMGVGLLERPHLFGLHASLYRCRERPRDLVRRRPVHGALRRRAVRTNRKP